MKNDPEILPKIARLSDEHGIDPATVIALLAINALAAVDFGSLSFWANVSQTVAARSSSN